MAKSLCATLQMGSNGAIPYPLIFIFIRSAPKNAGHGVQVVASSERVVSPLMTSTLSKPEVSCNDG
jgi:hypothetical protein